MDTIRVLIADDHQLFRDGLRALLLVLRFVVDAGGGFTSNNCLTARPVACCQLVQIPAPPLPLSAALPVWALPLAASGIFALGVRHARRREVE